MIAVFEEGCYSDYTVSFVHVKDETQARQLESIRGALVATIGGTPKWYSGGGLTPDEYLKDYEPTDENYSVFMDILGGARALQIAVKAVINWEQSVDDLPNYPREYFQKRLEDSREVVELIRKELPNE